MSPRHNLPRPALLLAAAIALSTGVLWAVARRGTAESAPAGQRSTYTVARGDFIHTVRFHGTVEAVRSVSVAVPRLAGPGANALVITKLAPAGSRVRKGDLLVEFDRQEQLKVTRDRLAEFRDFGEQIKKKRAEHQAAHAKNETELKQAENAVESARLETLKNDLLPRIEAEKNDQKLEEAKARLKQLRETFALKQSAAQAELGILGIQRDRAQGAMRHADRNGERMAIRAPLDGLVVLKTVWKGSQMGEVQEGEEIRAGVPVLEVVDPSAMQVRARVNQADVQLVRLGQPARIQLDAYPELAFGGRVEQLSPIGVTSGFSPKVRTFVAVVSIAGSDPKLTPDLSAAVDVELERRVSVVTVPRDAVRRDGERALVLVRNGSRSEARQVRLGAANDMEVIVESGLDAGAMIERHVGATLWMRGSRK